MSGIDMSDLITWDVSGLSEAHLEYLAAVFLRDYRPYKVFADGTGVWIHPTTYGKGRLCIGDIDNPVGYDRGFCYDAIERAFQAADEWDGVGEPDGWTRCINTGRRRRPDGDKSSEYILH